MSHDEDYGLGAEDSGELWRVSKGYSTEQWRMDLGKSVKVETRRLVRRKWGNFKEKNEGISNNQLLQDAYYIIGILLSMSHIEPSSLRK